MNFKKVNLPIALVFISIAAHSQTDTLYFDIGWEKAKKEDAVYFRTYKLENDKYDAINYYINGKVYKTGTYKQKDFGTPDEIKDGYFVYYDTLGNKTEEGAMVNGLRNGLWKAYFDSSNILQVTKYYANGSLTGQFKSCYRDGKTRRIDNYENGKLTGGQCFLENGQVTDYYPFEVPATPSCNFNYFLSANLRYPDLCREREIQGRVILEFFVDENGYVSNIKVLKSPHPLLSKEAIRVVKLMPRWHPPYKEGVAIKEFYVLPILFALE